MAGDVKTVIFPVRDLAKAKELFGLLTGVRPYADEAYYVGYRVNGQDIGLDPNGHAQGMTGPVCYWEVADINATIGQLTAAGAAVRQPARDVGGGKLVAWLTDADGNPVGLTQEP